VLSASAGVGAQVIETPIAFDSAQRVLAVTPAVAERFHLSGAPAWRVLGDYREARLYSVEPGGGFVLVVHRLTGALERYALATDERVALRDAVDAGSTTVGRPTADVGVDVVSEPAGSVRATSDIAWRDRLWPSASLADGQSGATSLYLLVTGASFFISYSAAQFRLRAPESRGFGLAAGGLARLRGDRRRRQRNSRDRARLGLVGTIAGVELDASSVTPKRTGRHLAC
jgi:hypothetical protein